MAATLADPYVTDLGAGVHARIQPDGTWWINNSGFVVGPDAVVLIDTCSTEARTRALLADVAATTDRPISTIVNTHHHGDHTNGNCLVPGATIVAHHRCRDAVARTPIGGLDAIWGPIDWGALVPAPATATFEHRLDLHVGDLLVELHHTGGPAHTTSDVVAWVPERRVLFTGDLVFNGGTPFFVMGSLAGSVASMGWLRSFGAEVLVPGHGPVCGPEVLDEIEAYLHLVGDLARDALGAGLEPLAAAQRADLGPFAALTDPERLVANLHRAMAEIRGTEPGEDIDYLTAFADMLTLNGGQPLRCHA